MGVATAANRNDPEDDRAPGCAAAARHDAREVEPDEEDRHHEGEPEDEEQPQHERQVAR